MVVKNVSPTHKYLEGEQLKRGYMMFLTPTVEKDNQLMELHRGDDWVVSFAPGSFDKKKVQAEIKRFESRFGA